ncbi:MAG: chromate transporter [Kiritimatiellae bacterium]|nr:chromate transporter [Kiritimatiellia bacterium]MBP5226212.1 chromate transporter [Kiritimatiellia bacterium]
MTLLLRIAGVFIKVGLLTIGGGLAMIPLLQSEMVSRGWLTNQGFLDILGIAQITPGPITINTATFVGFTIIRAAHPTNLWIACVGALVGTLAVCVPSIICINTLGRFWQNHREHPCMIKTFSILRPVVTGLVTVAALLLVREALWGEAAPLTQTPELKAALIALTAFLLTAFTKFSPFYVLGLGMVIGILLM